MEPKISEKAWNPELEINILKQWEEDKIYDFTPKENNFTIDTPHHIHQVDHGTLVQLHIIHK